MELILLKRILNIRLLFGHYHYTEYPKLAKHVLRLYCLVITIVLCWTYYGTFPDPFNLKSGYFYIMNDLCFNLLLSLIFRGNYLFILYDLVVNVQKLINTKIFALSYTSYIFLLVTYSYRFVNSLVNSKFSIFDIRLYVVCICTVSLLINRISKIIIFDTVYNLMIMLRKSLKSKFVSVSVICREEHKQTIALIRSYLHAYEELISFMDNMDTEIQCWVFFTLIFNFPKIVTVTHLGMAELLTDVKDGFDIFRTIIVVSYTIVEACLPAVFVELTAREVDIIKKLCKNILYTQRADEAVLLEIQYMLDYLNMRPFKYNIWRIISVDATLPLKYLSLCVTYVIVVAQFLNYSFDVVKA